MVVVIRSYAELMAFGDELVKKIAVACHTDVYSCYWQCR
jgi:hypothetical protein